MRLKKILNTTLRLMCMIALLATVTSCIKDDLSDCPSTFTLTVGAYDKSETALGKKEVKDVRLYVFDSDRRFVKKIDTQIGQPVTFQAGEGKDIHIVGWGNLGGGMQECSLPNPGDHKDNCLVSLSPQADSSNYFTSPDDLFRGEITIRKEEQRGEKELPIYREVGSLTVTLRNLKTFTGYNDNDYSIVVRDTHSSIDFYGNLTGNRVAYRSDGSFVTNNGTEDYLVPAFNMIPEEKGINIDIYYGTELIRTVSEDNSGNSITIEKDRLTNVLIDLKAQVSISVLLTDWGHYQVWKEF